MDEQIRTLERRAASGDRDAQASLRRARERASSEKLLVAELNRIASDIWRVKRRIERIGRFNKVHPERDVPLPSLWRSRHDDDPFTVEAAHRRRWRRVYRAWLRESGKRAIIDSWLAEPSPKCQSPDHVSNHNRAIGECVERRTIVLLPGPKHSPAQHQEWLHNHRLIDRARRRNRLSNTRGSLR